MSRTDTARETAGRAKDAVAPYAVSAKETALHYAEEAKQVLGPRLEALGPKAAAAGAQARAGAGQAAHAARVQYVKHVAPHLEHAFTSLPPETQKAALRAVHRAQEAALAAKLSAGQAAGQARATVVPKVAETFQAARESVTPIAQEAQTRGAAAVSALHGNVTAAEISALAAKNAKKQHRNGWATGLAVAGTLAIGTGVLAWQWYRKQNNPEWLTEPPAPVTPPTTQPASTGPAGASPATAAPGAPGAPAAPDAAGPTGTAGTAAGAPVGKTVLNGSVPREEPADGGRPEAAPADDDRPKPHDPRKPH
ncbi:MULTISPECIES: DUF5324 family protein [Kitasatospora]|uniref:Putative regulatory protein n=1 Tax=Kitasatospora setae (strain ATCC 33774 / DSM 43861 / JCM 3304 / KCC A-0304 / NBRC 14216 / KM-6054) TaxID=452652 RepID=E4MZF3_KITSK|nr:DUF5324 family protein [Kitasatospora setae]BAJ29727.1 putative regulatory protein [Kitasatospora setae KM-6054]